MPNKRCRCQRPHNLLGGAWDVRRRPTGRWGKRPGRLQERLACGCRVQYARGRLEDCREGPCGGPCTSAHRSVPHGSDLMTQRTLVVVAVAAGLGVVIGFMDSRPTWDDAGVTAGALLLVALVLGAIQPRAIPRGAKVAPLRTPRRQVDEGRSSCRQVESASRWL